MRFQRYRISWLRDGQPVTMGDIAFNLMTVFGDRRPVPDMTITLSPLNKMLLSTCVNSFGISCADMLMNVFPSVMLNVDANVGDEFLHVEETSSVAEMGIDGTLSSPIPDATSATGGAAPAASRLDLDAGPIEIRTPKVPERIIEIEKE